MSIKDTFEAVAAALLLLILCTLIYREERRRTKEHQDHNREHEYRMHTMEELHAATMRQISQGGVILTSPPINPN